MNYSSKDYWGRQHDREDLSSVGQAALPGEMNRWIYRSTRRNLRRFARRHGLRASGGLRMLEVGAGTGYWVDFWESMGWQVDGCDLVPGAVERLKAAHQRANFWCADVSAPEGLLALSGGVAAEGYDLVTATNVLLHVTEDEAFARALQNVAAVVRPGGHLLLVEPALTIKKKGSPYDPAKHSRTRVLRSYRRPLREMGLRLVAVEATTVLAANPLEASSAKKLRRYQAWWRTVAKSRKSPGTARWVGPLMYALDGVLMRTKEAPTSKMLLFRRAG